jgi:hypothetical protein
VEEVVELELDLMEHRKEEDEVMEKGEEMEANQACQAHRVHRCLHREAS